MCVLPYGYSSWSIHMVSSFSSSPPPLTPVLSLLSPWDSLTDLGCPTSCSLLPSYRLFINQSEMTRNNFNLTLRLVMVEHIVVRTTTRYLGIELSILSTQCTKPSPNNEPQSGLNKVIHFLGVVCKDAEDASGNKAI